jgi:hypothetical protein
MSNTAAIITFAISTLLACAAHADAPKPTNPHPELICQVVTKTLTVCTRK